MRENMTDVEREETRKKDRERKRLSRIDKKFKPHSLEVVCGKRRSTMSG